MTRETLIATWRTEADVLRRRGQVGAADLLEGCADELARVMGSEDAESITLAEAQAVSGYSVAHLRRLIAQGDLQNVAKKGAPRVRRGDLPRKPGRRAA